MASPLLSLPCRRLAPQPRARYVYIAELALGLGARLRPRTSRRGDELRGAHVEVEDWNSSTDVGAHAGWRFRWKVEGAA